ncbi:hypothetical protein [Marivita sp.]|uniref:hypothetical protein n=1 Tax=Marivita sp. TaxID=2003365 RepID=UPI0025C57B1B|nr:hypothetical protein [Marivita sp.]
MSDTSFDARAPRADGHHAWSPLWRDDRALHETPVADAVDHRPFARQPGPDPRAFNHAARRVSGRITTLPPDQRG